MLGQRSLADNGIVAALPIMASTKTTDIEAMLDTSVNGDLSESAPLGESMVAADLDAMALHALNTLVDPRSDASASG